MTDQELTALIQQISLQAFQRPFTHQANFNARLKTTGGRYHLADHHIDINPKILATYDVATLTGVIKHELCHYHLHLAGLPYDHRSVQFKQLLAQVGGSRFAPPLPKAGQKQELYQCTNCHKQYVRQRKLNTARYACGVCGGKLVHIRTIQQKAS